MHLSDWVAHVDHVETTVNQAKEDQEAADAEYQALNLSKQKAAADKDECDRDLARLEAEKKKAEKNFKIRQARIIARREKATAAWDSANGKTMHVNEKKAMADFKFSTAKDLLDERKKRLPVFQLPVERVSRTYAFMSAEEIFDNLEIPFDYSSQQYFSLTTLREFNRALKIFGYSKGHMLHSKHDCKLPDLWRHTCEVFGIPVDDATMQVGDEVIAKAQEGLQSFLEEAVALANAQQLAENDNSDEDVESDEDDQQLDEQFDHANSDCITDVESGSCVEDDCSDNH